MERSSTSRLTEILGRTLSCRGDHIVGPVFFGGLWPVETVPGESLDLRLRIGESTVLLHGSYPHDSA